MKLRCVFGHSYGSWDKDEVVVQPHPYKRNTRVIMRKCKRCSRPYGHWEIYDGPAWKIG